MTGACVKEHSFKSQASIVDQSSVEDSVVATNTIKTLAMSHSSELPTPAILNPHH